MTKESIIGIRGSPIFRETFNSFDSIKKNGGNQTAITLSNGVATFGNGQIIYPHKQGTFSVRIKARNISLPSAISFFIDFSNYSTINGYIALSSAGNISVKPTGYNEIYINNVKTTVINAESSEIVVTGLIIPESIASYPNMVVGNRGNLGAYNVEADIDLIEIYEGTLSDNEVKFLYENSLFKEPSNDEGYDTTELINNGTFDADSDWTKGTGWTISGGKAVGTSATGYLYQNAGISPYKSYLISCDVIITSGSVYANLNGVPNVFKQLSNGINTFVLTGTSSVNGNFSFNSLTTFTGTIDNVSVQELTNSELTPILEYDFVKNKSAYNKVEYSQDMAQDPSFDSNAAWIKQNANATITGGQAVWTDSAYIYEDAMQRLLPGRYKITVDAEFISTNARFYLNNTSYGYVDVTTSGVYYLDTTFDGTHRLLIAVIGQAVLNSVTYQKLNNENQSLTDVKFGQQGLIANGSTTKLDTGSTADLTGDITFEAIINPASYGGNNSGRLIDNGAFVSGVSVAYTNSLILASDSNNITRSGSNSILINDKPKHCVVTRKNNGDGTSSVNFYVDNVLSGTANQDSREPTPGTTNLFIANRNVGDRTFDGAIKIVNVYRGLMTTQQITQRYNYWKSVRGYL